MRNHYFITESGGASSHGFCEGPAGQREHEGVLTACWAVDDQAARILQARAVLIDVLWRFPTSRLVEFWMLEKYR